MAEVKVYLVNDVNGSNRFRADKYEIRTVGDRDRIVFEEGGEVTYVTWTADSLLPMGAVALEEPVAGDSADDSEGAVEIET
jgi:hypothetical protein